MVRGPCVVDALVAPTKEMTVPFDRGEFGYRPGGLGDLLVDAVQDAAVADDELPVTAKGWTKMKVCKPASMLSRLRSNSRPSSG